ncbi:MAG: UDP-N-acetylmuramoylalanine--D-glutamate ligase [Sphingomonadales bacterium]|jgi:UDP-N-acetylmuramoylalanine--D-glutamate ligase|nr:UDP-N-acetylmuramoylalanine--D-glutamate ligase [Sphingomonadales bacterium]
MIASPAFRGKRYAVLGLARSGLATVEALLASGAEVAAWDNREETRAATASLFAGEGRGPDADSGLDPGLRRGTFGIADPIEIDLAGYDAVVVSPGVPLNTHPIAAKAREAGVPVLGDIELFAQARADLPPHKVVGITGTNGKSTTTALVHHILKTAGVPTAMGGNIGLPILAQDPLPEGGVYVLELSSYQIDLTFSLDCDVAVLLNVTPDHLDRYDGFDAYAASKARLFEMQSAGHVALVGDDDPIDQSDWPNLQGPHNAQNARAAMAVCGALGLGREAIARSLASYPGLPHRMERIAEKNGILFVNDSKATNPDSTAPALAAYPYIHWIVGGRAKSEGLGPCADQLGHVRAAYTIGEAGPMFARLLHDRVPVVEQSVTLDTAVRNAARFAKTGEVVLLSPACASFDQFRDYEARGDAFRAMVGALP